MRRQPYCAKTPTTHQFIGGEETECWSQSVYGDDLEAMVVRSQWGNLARMPGLHPYSFSKDISFINGSISFGMLLFCTQRRRSHFFSPRPHAYLPCFAPLSRIERLSLLCSPNWKIMDLTNWSFNAIDTIFGFPGNLTAPTERSQRAIRWTRGRGGESCVLRLFLWRTLKISTYSEPW